MDIKKKLIIAMAGLLPALALSTAHAGDFDSEGMSADNSMSSMSTSSNHDSLSLGIFYDESVGGVIPKVTFMKDWFVASTGFGYQRQNPSMGNSYNEYYVPLSLGYLRDIGPNLSYSMGPAGVWTKTTQTGAENGYVYGPEASLYYQAAKNVLFTASVMPISKQKNTDGSRSTEIFQEGSIGMSYTFD